MTKHMSVVVLVLTVLANGMCYADRQEDPRYENRWIFAGDLNSTPDSVAITELKKGFVALSDAATPTWPTSAPPSCRTRCRPTTSRSP